MRWNLWLAQPETERSLGTVLRITVAVVALWTLAAAYGVWSTRAALAAAQLSVLAQSNQLSQIARDLPEKRRQARKAAEVKVVSSQGAGSAEITEELADLARAAGAEVRGVRIGNGAQAGVAAQAVPTPAGTGGASAKADGSPGAASSPTAQASVVTDDEEHETFECNISGEYPALTRFLSGLAASHHVLDITSLQVTLGDAIARPDAPRLEMQISGTIYETSGKT